MVYGVAIGITPLTWGLFDSMHEAQYLDNWVSLLEH